jgi:hypothetical protein
VIHERARLSILTSLASQPKGLGFADPEAASASSPTGISAGTCASSKRAGSSRSRRDSATTGRTRRSPVAVGRRRFLEYLTVLEKVIADAADAAGADAPARRKRRRGSSPA